MYPTKYFITSGVGKGHEHLVAFDCALLNAGISNYNLVKISSILPARCRESVKVDLKEGSPLLTAYATISSSNANEKIATAVGIGIPTDADRVGVIMEYAGITDAKTAEAIVTKMVKTAMKNHSTDLKEIRISSAEGVVEKENESLCLISAVSLW